MTYKGERLYSGIMFFLFLFSAAWTSIDNSLRNPSQADDPEFERCLEIEIKRLEETYSLLETFAQKIWPGWDNYQEVEFRVQFPNLVFLLFNPLKEFPGGY